MNDNIDEKRDSIIKRLNRIEGQIKGIKKMINNNICCNDVLIQISAAKAAMSKVGIKLLEIYSENCIDEMQDDNNRERVLKELFGALESYMKFGR